MFGQIAATSCFGKEKWVFRARRAHCLAIVLAVFLAPPPGRADPLAAASRPGGVPPTPASAPAAAPTTEASPVAAEQWLGASLWALRTGWPHLALACLNRAAAQHPDSPAVATGTAKALTDLGLLDSAEVIYRLQLTAEPADDAARYNLAVLQWRRGRLDRAEDLLEDLLTRQGDYLPARENLATLYELNGKLADARAQWQAVARQRPKAAFALAKLGELSLLLGDTESAMDAYAAAARNDPQNPRRWLDLAAAATVSGSLGRAALASERAARLEPDRPEVWARLIELYLAIHRQSGERAFVLKASSAASHLVKKASDDPASWRLLGEVFHRLWQDTGQDRYRNGAIRAWQWSLKLQPDQPRVKGRLYRLTGTATEGP